MNATDIFNSLVPSPGFITAITTASTFSYTALSNIELNLQCSVGNSSDNIRVNGAKVLGTPGTANYSYEVRVYVAKGQVTTIDTTGSASAQVVLSARSIQ